MKKFINLYNTTEYSFLDSLIRVEELVRLSKEAGLHAVVLSDHNNMFALGSFLYFCQKYDIKPIIGLDLDVGSYRFILLAKNYRGYQKLNKLILKFNKKIELKIDDLYDQNLYILDHPSQGYYAQTKDNKLSKWDNYFINCSDSNITNGLVFRTNKLIKSSDNETLQVIQKLGNNKVESFDYDYFDSPQVDNKILDRIDKIIESCNIIFPEKKLKLASYENKNNNDGEKLLIELLNKGIVKHKNDLKDFKDIWKERLEYELSVIKKLEYVNYFLIIQDLVNWAKSKDISIGPGRGSAAGSLISYLLNITTINPLRYNLLFERFLNPERVSWPDIDIDIQDDRRNEVFKYLQDKYGFNNTALISTFQTMGAKMAIRDVGRVLGINLVDINRISKTLSSGETFDECLAKNADFKAKIVNFPDLLLHARKLEGLPRQQSFHAAGIIIANEELSNFVPVGISNDETFQQVQMPMNFIEEFGLLKIDLLGLKTLTEIKMMEEQIPFNSHFDNLVLNNPQELQDPITFAMLNQGFTEGIFQLESPGMKKTVKKVNVDSFDDLYAIISLFRPGPMGYIEDYSYNKKHPQSIKKIQKDYDEIVKSTYGILVYQEQIMQIAQRVCDMTFAQADFLRKAISKKNDIMLKEYRKIFYDGAIKKGLSEKVINKIYDNIERFGQYGFNKSHAVCYAYITMKMAYYKARYSLIFYSALISNSQGAHATINKYVDEIKNLNLSVKSPNILYSKGVCQIIDDVLYLPLSMVKFFGNEGVKKVVNWTRDNGEFDKNLIKTFIKLRFAGIKDSAMDNLIKANCFIDFGHMKYIENANGMLKDTYNIVSSKKNYEEAEAELNKLGYLNTSFDDVDRDISYEKSNELKYLGEVYNAFATSIYEKKYNKRLSDIDDYNSSNVVIEICAIRKLKNKPFNVIEARDSSRKVTFFISKSEWNKFDSLKVDNVVEAQVAFRSGGLKLISCREVK